MCDGWRRVSSCFYIKLNKYCYPGVQLTHDLTILRKLRFAWIVCVNEQHIFIDPRL